MFRDRCDCPGAQLFPCRRRKARRSASGESGGHTAADTVEPHRSGDGLHQALAAACYRRRRTESRGIAGAGLRLVRADPSPGRGGIGLQRIQRRARRLEGEGAGPSAAWAPGPQSGRAVHRRPARGPAAGPAVERGDRPGRSAGGGLQPRSPPGSPLRRTAQACPGRPQAGAGSGRG